MLNLMKNLWISRKQGDIAWSYMVYLLIAIIVLGLLMYLIIKSKSGFDSAGSKINDILS
jgi:uncharacterized protein (UPF0333 family)